MDQLSYLEEETKADHRSEGSWNGVKGQLNRLFRATTTGPRRIWKGIEWRLARLKREKYSQFIYRLAIWYRPKLRQTIFIGITGSAGKTTTKDLLASILERHYPKGQKGAGTLNGPDDVARLILKTRPSDAYCITEIAVDNEAGIAIPLALFRPTVGVVTTIGGDHVSAYGSLEGVAAEKSKLVKTLPANGISVLNADDPLVLGMQSQFSGATITYGMTESAMLRGEAIDSSWPNRLSFTVKWNGHSARVQTQLCGDHWVPVVLAALATSVALGVPLDVAAEAVASVEPFEGRMSPVELGDGVTFMRDDWKAPWWSIPLTFEFMRQARATRKVIVMGTISDYSGPYTPRYVKAAKQALEVADCVVFVGPRASACLRAKRNPQDQLYAFPSLQNASTFLQGYLRSGDLVLLKGSVRTDHLERLILVRTNTVECWREACRRMNFCNECRFLHVASGAESVQPAEVQTTLTTPKPETFEHDPLAGEQPPLVIVGLGNPGELYSGTPHNVGQCVADILAQRLNATWAPEGDLALVARTQWLGRPVYLMKLLTLINNAGPTIVPITEKLGFTVRDCVFIHDDLDLPVGGVRLRQRGGDGGHRGVRSIIQAFQDDQFGRLKVGIGKPIAGQSVSDYVLTPFPAEQFAAVHAANNAAADLVLEQIRRESVSRSKSSSTLKNHLNALHSDG